ncbi:MAG: flagellar motor switch protein FliN [Actinomycetota bacterium]|nr:flagellar motor switch protein FliN [Actinomycetota bacterium]
MPDEIGLPETEFADAAQTDAGQGEAPVQTVTLPETPELGLGAPLPTGPRDLRLLADVEVQLAVQLGRVRLPLRELLTLDAGSVVELDRSAESPVDVLVNGTLVARGEVVVIDGEFGVRITSIVDR